VLMSLGFSESESTAVCFLLVIPFIFFGGRSALGKGAHIDKDGDGIISDEEWAEYEEWAEAKDKADVIEASSLKSNQNQSKTEISGDYGKVGSKCSELECKGTVMYKSKFCYKHRNLK